MLSKENAIDISNEIISYGSTIVYHRHVISPAINTGLSVLDKNICHCWVQWIH